MEKELAGFGEVNLYRDVNHLKALAEYQRWTAFHYTYWEQYIRSLAHAMCNTCWASDLSTPHTRTLMKYK